MMATSQSYLPELYAERSTPSRKRQNWIRAEALWEIERASIMAIDFATAASVVLFSLTLFSRGLGRGKTLEPREIGFTALAGLLTILFLHREQLPVGRSERLRMTERTLRASLHISIVLCAVAWLLQPAISARAVAAICALLPLLMVLQKLAVANVWRQVRTLGWAAEPVAVCVRSEEGLRFAAKLSAEPGTGLRAVVLIDPPANGFEHSYGVKRASCVDEVLSLSLREALLASMPCRRLFLAPSDVTVEEFAELAEVSRQVGVQLAWVPQEHNFFHENSSIGPEHRRNPFLFTSGIIKRSFDVLASAAFLFILSPILFVIGILIRLETPGPALFRQKRIGKDGREFCMYKFRSMHTSAPVYQRSPESASDLRITRIGRTLRRTSMDELPQLLTVLRGDMSLVGPRPEMPFLVEQYRKEHHARLEVKPGLTGLWQLSSARAHPIHENLQHDQEYIAHRSFFMDVAILLHTLFFAMRTGI
jgi:exopolysaccharide biosynthesis polyprenyl glycosylphosphotransferase